MGHLAVMGILKQSFVGLLALHTPGLQCPHSLHFPLPDGAARGQHLSHLGHDGIIVHAGHGDHLVTSAGKGWLSLRTAQQWPLFFEILTYSCLPGAQGGILP